MKASKFVMVIHPDSDMRNALRSVLQDHQRRVITGDSWLDLISDRSGESPAVILLDRTLLNPEKVDVLSLLHQRWTDSEIVLLPEGLENPGTRADTMIQLLRHIDRLLAMTSTRELLTASEERH